MTVALGLMLEDRVLLCADTLYSDGYTKEYRICLAGQRSADPLFRPDDTPRHRGTEHFRLVLGA